jgi:3',5'-nucleoside bisphosphate phosphatase
MDVLHRRGRFDLQSHSSCSDGELTAPEVVSAAAAAGIELLALTDHDTVDGVDEALAAGARHGVAVVPAVELSSVDGAHEELHVLGYGIDHHAGAFADALVELRLDRENRVLAMAQRLRDAGFGLDDRELEARRRAGKPLGRPHLARAVLGNPDNAQRLATSSIGGTSDLFAKHLVPGADSYVPRSMPTVARAIDLIHQAGGVAVWAHPFWDIDSADEVRRTLRRFVDLGLDGVEAFYPTHTASQVGLLCAAADSLELLATGSSDFHGPGHETFSSFGAFDLYDHVPRLGPIPSYVNTERV